jgi:hypothetical protein
MPEISKPHLCGVHSSDCTAIALATAVQKTASATCTDRLTMQQIHEGTEEQHVINLFQ